MTLAARLAAERNDPLSAGFRLPDIDQQIHTAFLAGLGELLRDAMKEPKR